MFLGLNPGAVDRLRQELRDKVMFLGDSLLVPQ